MVHKFIQVTPQELQRHLSTTPIYYGDLATAAGTLRIYATDRGIFETHFCAPKTIQEKYPNALPFTTDQLTQLLQQKNLPLFITGTDFQRDVWRATCSIPAGTTESYSSLAQKIGQPKAFRAVARALATNHIAYFIPCHRVIAKNGAISGYAWGVTIKEDLLREEQYTPQTDAFSY